MCQAKLSQRKWFGTGTMEMKWALASYLAQTTTARAVNGLLSIDLEGMLRVGGAISLAQASATMDVCFDDMTATRVIVVVHLQ